MNERFLTVSRINQPSRIPDSRSKSVASIRLTGMWVEDFGFAPGQRFIVRGSPGKLEVVAEWREKQEQLLLGEAHGTDK